MPLIDIVWSLNMAVPGVVAHQWAMKAGELVKIRDSTYRCDDVWLERRSRQRTLDG